MTSETLLDDVLNDTEPNPALEVYSTLVLRWVFIKDIRMMTCEIRREDHDYSVLVIPQWDPSDAEVEDFDRASDAFWHHAELAESLRDSGWMLVRETDAQPQRAVA